MVERTSLGPEGCLSRRNQFLKLRLARSISRGSLALSADCAISHGDVAARLGSASPDPRRAAGGGSTARIAWAEQAPMQRRKMRRHWRGSPARGRTWPSELRRLRQVTHHWLVTVSNAFQASPAESSAREKYALMPATARQAAMERYNMSDCLPGQLQLVERLAQSGRG